MAKRRTQLDRAIEDIDQQILVLQKTRETLVKHQPKAALKAAPKQSPPKPLLASS